ncbi:hypothetical protein SAMN05443247_00025 [Bradyrhizobium erythrophlei]|jgi:chromosome segregation ATPase|nr:hypothetical protein SAMN05443247_00025 [Bradyrhizobium erythrophlei]
MSNAKTLEDAVAETALAVTGWKSTIAKIETQLNVAGLALARAKKQREIHALKASMNDAAAVAAIKAARSDQLAAEETINDLKTALPAAQEQLAAAEKAAASARDVLGKFHAAVLMRQRIDVASKLDAISADFARVYAEYEKLGREIVNMPGALPTSMHGVTDHEAVLGARRVRASLPKFFWKLFPGAIHDEMKTENLATAEARFWNLPEQEKAKAA